MVAPLFISPKERFFAIVNPAAGGGKSAKLAGATLSRLREKGLKIDVVASTGPGHAGELAHEAYTQEYRQFLAVGGDGTAHEILNGPTVSRSVFFRSVQETLSCAISATTAPKCRFRPCSETANALWT